jgi:flagellar biosynthesis protein FlhG
MTMQGRDQPSGAAGHGSGRRATIMAVTSGKGGVGKTFMAANLAHALASAGERVLVLDADLGLANLDVVLNLYPKITLHDVFTGKASLEDAILPAPGGFSVLLAGSGLVEYSRLTPEVRDQLLGVIETVAPRFDRIILDTGAGISDVVLYALSLADEVMVVVTPEPTSMTDAYATIKVLTLQQQQRRNVRVVINQTSRLGEGRAVRGQLQLVVDRFVTPLLPAGSGPVRLELLGEVPTDAAVRESVQKRRLLLELAPGAPAARAVQLIAERIHA